MKRWLLIPLFLLFLAGCRVPSRIVTPIQDPIEDTLITTVDSVDTVKTPADTVKTPVDTIDFAKVIKKVESPPKKIYKNWVRIALVQKTKKISVFAYEKYRILDGKKRITISPGVLKIVQDQDGALVSAHGKSATVQLPCTLSVVSGNAVWDIEEKGYRGEIILQKDKGNLMVINYLPVESYLRGVLPLEIGVRSEVELEALKAQAVAARTYTYAKMLQRKEWHYDLLPTVSDQVYGGTEVEAPLTDRAVDETKDKVMAYNGALVEAFYHSTCGGRTAAVHEVWETTPRDYLVSRSDLKANGTAWCAISKYAVWQEKWERSQFNSIVKRYSNSTKGVAPLQGDIQNIAVQDHTTSGRVKRCYIQTTNGNWNYGKDKIRFIFRRPNSSHSILRSSHFRISMNGTSVHAHGKGFGHGIGMCQMGAIGRARAGQSYTEILKAYYRGVSFVSIEQLYSFTR